MMPKCFIFALCFYFLFLEYYDLSDEDCFIDIYIYIYFSIQSLFILCEVLGSRDGLDFMLTGLTVITDR